MVSTSGNTKKKLASKQSTKLMSLTFRVSAGTPPGCRRYRQITGGIASLNQRLQAGKPSACFVVSLTCSVQSTLCQLAESTTFSELPLVSATWNNTKGRSEQVRTCDFYFADMNLPCTTDYAVHLDRLA